MKHTKAPWICKPVQTYQEPGYAVFWQDTSKPGVYTRRLDYKGCFTEADARLISAAPELLAALRAVVKVADRATVEFDAARTAIAKAMEGQP